MGSIFNYQRLAAPKIAKCRAARHLPVLPSWLLVLALYVCVPAQHSESGITLSEQDIAETIGFYRSTEPVKAVANFRLKMPPPVTDKAFRASIHQNLPAQLLKLRIADPRLVAGLRQVFDPVLSLYGRSDVYDLMVINHEVPFIMADSGVVVVVSTGLVKSAASDDELLNQSL
jgi:hypothetical protein